VRLYSSHFPPPGHDAERPPALVRDGFSWLGLLLGWLALLRPGSWLCAALAGLVTLLIGLLARQVPAAWVLLPGMHLTVALFAADWRRWELRQAGFVPGPIVAGADRGQALLRLLDQRPDLLGRPA
jgi:xanthosine utilization system XapX-like protein